MRVFHSEFSHSYENYSFGYCNYVEREVGDKLWEIYQNGFLPYSGSFDKKDIFYMARSARVNLKNFTFNSENRRIAKRFDGKFEKESIPLSEFDWKDEKFISFCADYFVVRHGKKVMPKNRLLFLLNCGLISNIVVYKSDGIPKAYVFLVSDNQMSHFWFSFYDLELIKQSLGMWLMIDAAKDAVRAEKKYLYLGTVYAEKALYKTNFDNLEYWTGSEWSRDIKKLKNRSKTDNQRTLNIIDEWKGI